MPLLRYMPPRRRRGIALLLFAMMSIVIFPMLGLSIEAGLLFVVRTKLSAAGDAAALAAARSLSRGADLASQTTSAQTTATNYFNANFPTGFLLTNSSTITTTVSQSAANVRTVQTSITATLPVYFLQVLKGVGPSVTINTSSTATRRDSNVVLVMDRSGSLQASGSCAPMIAAASGFVNNFAEQRDYLGLVTFASSSYYMDYPIATNFKSSTPSLSSIINTITCVGGTGSAAGLWSGYTALAQLNQPGALNVIVFFTDGQPTALTGRFPIKASSPCGNHAPGPPPGKLAVLTMTSSPSLYGLLNLSNGAVPIANDNVVQSGDATCKFVTSGAGSVATDVASIPNPDYFGDNTNSGYASPVNLTITGTASTDAASIRNASINATDEAAKHIRNGNAITAVTPTGPAAAVGKSLAGTVIFSIGLGTAASDPPDAVLLKRIANDPGSSSYDSTKQAGLYIFCQTTSDLDDAFHRVAAEILRLSK